MEDAKINICLVYGIERYRNCVIISIGSGDRARVKLTVGYNNSPRSSQSARQQKLQLPPC